MRNSTNAIALGITDDQIALGNHLIHFWQNEEEWGLPRRLTHVQQQESGVAAADKTGIKIAQSHV